MEGVISLLKKREAKKAIALLEEKPWLIGSRDPENNTLAHFAVSYDSGEMLSYLVNTIYKTSYSKEHRDARLTQIFEEENSQGYSSVELSVALSHFNFMIFMLQHCCPKGNKLLTEATADMAFKARSAPCLLYILENAPSRMFYSPDRYWFSALFSGHTRIEKHLRGKVRNQEIYYRFSLDQNYEGIEQIIRENPRLAWDSLYDNYNIAELRARQGDIRTLKFIRDFIQSQPYDGATRDNLLRQTFQQCVTGKKCTLEQAILSKDCKTLEFLVEECCPDGFELFSRKFSGKETLLYQAVRFGDVEMVHYILSNTRNVLEMVNTRVVSVVVVDWHGSVKQTYDTILEAADRRSDRSVYNYLCNLDIARLQKNNDSETRVISRSQKYMKKGSLAYLVSSILLSEAELRERRT